MAVVVLLHEPLKHQAEFVADNIQLFLNFFGKKISLDISCELSVLADDSHEISRLIFFEK